MQNAFSYYIKTLLLAEAKYARKKANAEQTPEGESQSAGGTGTPASG